MKIKHTPGPWYIKRGNEGILTTISNRKTYCKHSFHIAIIFPWIRRKSSEHEANANLIAAAPELLLACNFALQGIIHGEVDNTTKEILETAIKKATS